MQTSGLYGGAVCVTVCVFVACSSSTPRAANEAPGSDAGDLDAASAPPACSSPDASTEQSCGTLAFATSPVASRPRNHHVTLVNETASGTTLYAIGGANAGAAIGFVDRVPLNADGSLGQWVTEPALPVAAGGLVGELVSGVVVVGGGTTPEGVATKSVYASLLNPDGSLAGWKAGPPLNEARMHGGSMLQGNKMWVLGGFDGSSIWSDIVSTTVQPDGTIASWAPAGHLPTPLSHFTVTLLGDYVYLTGGLQQADGGDANPPDVTNTWLGQIEADGTLGGWTALTPLPVAEAAHAAFAYGGYLNICGGINNVPAEEDRCWRAPILADHTLGAFAEIASLPIARGHVHQMPVVGTQVYSIAGAIDFNLDSTTHIAIGSFETDPQKMNRQSAPRAVRPVTPGPVPMHGAKCPLHKQ